MGGGEITEKDILGEAQCKKCGNIEKWYYRATLEHVDSRVPLRAVPQNRKEIDTGETFKGGYLTCSKCKEKIYVEKI
ncbi:hypothetical protein GND98_012310 [Clostridium butyricum]|uniref:Uncharacterized protein n=1 Tax=Clostridium butyricum TaxID=1492 RepID=A0A6L9EQ86_CLOBU|nr:hypothetical protein [Clostridium butyricum]